MLIERLNVLLPYQVRRLTEEDGDEIFALQRRHPKYHALFLNHKVKRTYCDFAIRPLFYFSSDTILARI